MQNVFYIVLIILIALVIALFQYVYKKPKTKRNYTLAAFRFLTVFCILLLLVNPKIKRKIVTVNKPLLTIAVDNSSSIKLNQLDNEVNELVKLLKNNNLLQHKFNINWLQFGSELKQLDTLNFTAEYTNISAAINQLNKLQKNNVGASILITDGNHNTGNDVEYTSTNHFIYPIIVGDTTSFEDIYINQINTNANTYINNKFPVEVFINYEGLKVVTKQFVVRNKNSVVYRKQLSFSAKNNSQILNFELPAVGEGKQFYSTSIDTLENEKNTTNNKKDFAINVVNNVAKIALVSNLVHPDVGALKKAIESSKHNKVSIVKPDELKNLEAFQFVILYQPNTKFKSVFETLKTTKKNYFIITGLETNWTFLSDIQQNFKKNNTSQISTIEPVINATFEHFNISTYNFNSFPPLLETSGNINFNTAYNSLLFKKTNGVVTNTPLLATLTTDNVKMGVLFGENSWKWRMHSYTLNTSFSKYDEFITSLIQYLTSNVQTNRLTVAVKDFYSTSEDIKISASYTDTNFEFNNNAKLWLTIYDENRNSIKKIPFSANQSSFTAEVSDLPSGIYAYKVTVENEQFNTTGSFKILPFNIEKQEVNAKYKHLKNVAVKAKSNAYLAKNFQQAIDDLLQNQQLKSVEKVNSKTKPLIDWHWLLITLVMLLSAEWFLRKYLGEI